MKLIQIILVSVTLTLQSSSAFDFGVSNDLWDVAQGTTITAHSPFDSALGSPQPFDARDIFGGLFGDFLPESGDVVFTDGMPAGFIHFVEWKTLTSVTLGSFKLYAAEDNPPIQRHINRFRLLAKSEGSPTFDLTLYDSTPQTPYDYVNAAQFLLIDATIPAVTAQEFRAEFYDRGGTPFGGPRVIELDAFAVPEPTVVTLLSFGALAWWLSKRKTR